MTFSIPILLNYNTGLRSFREADTDLKFLLSSLTHFSDLQCSGKWFDDGKVEFYLSRGDLFFVNRKQSIEQLLTIHCKTYHRAVQYSG